MTDSLSPLKQLWLCEAIRLREEQTGLLEDREACRKARVSNASLAQRLQIRGLFLAQRDGLLTALQHWLQGAKLAVWLLLISALLTGVVLAKTALSGAPDAINIFWALTGLIGLNLVSLLVWLFSLVFSRPNNSPLSQIWLWLSNTLARDAQAVQLALLCWYCCNATTYYVGLWSLIAQLVVTHAVHSLITLVALLTTRRYGFVWESTLVASDAFIVLVSKLGTPAAWLGFAVPDSELIQRSGMQALDTEHARQVWASWLLGMLIIYGIVPRLVCALFCQWRWRRGVQHLHLDADDPVWHIYQQRVQPSSERIGIVDAAPAALPSASSGAQLTGQAAVLLAIELDDSIDWPPQLPDQVANAGVIDTREQRRAVLEQLSQQPPARLLIACNPQRSADRGTLHLIAELSRCAQHTRIWLLPGTVTDEARLSHWQEQLDQLNLPHSRTAPWAWLEHGDD